jgi:poly(A) polymerase
MQIAPDQIDPDAAKVVLRLRDNDHLAYLVGGCVRDLLLGRKPKDFDVVTSATPDKIRRLFKNCRIIGRRFRLAHIFYGPKIIETSTFRANPRELEEEDGEGGESESGDLLIRRDNVFGTPEEDARRRDFTINGLFYDLKTGQVIDHVNGLIDLEARVVRTIGDPDIRFREDPIRILRAVKFAARCDLTIEPETYRRMMEHRGEIAKCAQARVSEEFYRLLRGGAAKRSMELLVETDMLQIFAPDLARALRVAPDALASLGDEEATLRRARLWAYLAALDRSTERRPTPPSNALILAVILLPQLRDALDPRSTGVRDRGLLVSQALAGALAGMRPSRRDSEVARQILAGVRNALRGNQMPDETLRLRDIIVDAETADPTLAGRPILAEPGAAPAPEQDEELGTTLDADLGDRGRRRRRGRRGGGRLRDEGSMGSGAPSGPPQHAGGGSSHPRPSGPPTMDLPALLAAVRNLMPPSPRPGFLGGGGFGGPWSSRIE